MNFQELEKRNKILEKRWKIVIVIAILFLVTGPLALYIVKNKIDKAAVTGKCENPYLYVNKSIVCEPPVIKKTGYAELQEKTTQYINGEISAKRISDAAVYFRDLKNGPVWGVNELTDFAPASLLKVPLALVYLREAESRPEVLQQKLSYPPHPQWETVAQTFVPEESIKPNTAYTVEDLLERMVKYSDNNSYGVLEAYLEETDQKDIINKTFLELGILAPKDLYDQVVDVRRYASIYRALFNASILTPDSSEKVLGWLIEANFLEGLKSGIPEDVKAASKFGERLLPDGTKQLHDCGIIYFPNNPYLLCVMTKGTDFSPMAKVISTISKDVYAEVDSRKIK